jgi:hypothetical protein
MVLASLSRQSSWYRSVHFREWIKWIRSFEQSSDLFTYRKDSIFYSSIGNLLLLRLHLSFAKKLLCSDSAYKLNLFLATVKCLRQSLPLLHHACAVVPVRQWRHWILVYGKFFYFLRILQTYSVDSKHKCAKKLSNNQKPKKISNVRKLSA